MERAHDVTGWRRPIHGEAHRGATLQCTPYAMLFRLLENQPVPSLTRLLGDKHPCHRTPGATAPGITAGTRTRLLAGMGSELEDQDAEVLVHPRLFVRVPASGVIG